MNYKKHMLVFGGLALMGFIIFWFSPQIGAVIFLPAIGAYFGARQASTEGPSQPRRLNDLRTPLLDLPGSFELVLLRQVLVHCH